MDKHDITYSDWKKLIDKKHPAFYETESQFSGGSQNYVIYTGNRDFLFKHKFTNESDVTDWKEKYKMTSKEVSGETEVLLNLVNYGNRDPRNEDGKLIASEFPSTAKHVNVKSFNFCDRTSWYDQAKHVSKETFTASADQKNFDLAHANVINATQGNIHDEDHLNDDQDRDYKIEVWINEDKKDEDDFHRGRGSRKYKVDYSDGEIKFHHGLNEGDTVEVSYHYEDGSKWNVIPKDGKKLLIAKVEIQADANMSLQDTVFFEIGYYDQNGDWNNVETPNIYKRWHDVIIESNEAHPQHKPPGNPGKRDLKNKINTYKWDYQSLITLKSSLNLQIRIYNEHDEEHGGDYLSITLYCLVEDE